MLATVFLTSSLRSRAIEERLKSLSNLSQALAAETGRTLEAVDFVGASMAERIQNARISDVQQLVEAMSSRATFDTLQDTVSGVPFIDALTLADASGEIINTSRYWPPPKSNLSDRAYFAALKNPNGPTTSISAPLTGRISGRSGLFVARRIAAPSGAFLGAIIASLDMAYLESTFSKIDLGPDGLIALVRYDGLRLASTPASVVVDIPAPTAEMAALAATLAQLPTDGGILAAGVLDGQRRLAVREMVWPWPATLVVSETVQSVEASIWRSQLPIVVAALLVCIVIGLATAFAIRHERGQGKFIAMEQNQARRDVLTGLPNRLQFAEDIQAIGREGRQAPFALLFLDLDYFKVVNDNLGHDVGDGVLLAVARRILSVLGPRDTVARLGGDEFAIIRQGVEGDDDALTLAAAVTAAVRAPFQIEHRQVVVGCTIGIALCPRDGNDALSLLKSADLALYHAKNRARGSTSVFSASLGEAARARHSLQLRLDEAWRERQFTLAFQPIFETCSRKLTGFEALLRWTHPELGAVRPDVFIPIAEETGLINPIGAWVLEEACRAAAEWPGALSVAVNLSPFQFRGGAAVRQVRDALEHSGLPGRRLELEITESSLLIEGAGVRAALEDFHTAGISIALDDFGTGYSSLSHLKYLRISRIKVDRSFIMNVTDDPRDRAIVASLLGLARSLGLKSTAEGIETEAQIALVQAQGCTHLQGYLLGRPGTAAEACQLARSVCA